MALFDYEAVRCEVSEAAIALLQIESHKLQKEGMKYVEQINILENLPSNEVSPPFIKHCFTSWFVADSTEDLEKIVYIMTKLPVSKTVISFFKGSSF